jgi:hypothetical protein|nr:MAG TPA: Major capsid protein [Caudoviricetes sp.]
MAADKFIPQIWSAKILDALDKTLVYAQLFNRDYEGEITDVGDTVHIAQVGDVAIKDFKCDTDLDAPDDVTTTDTVLKIDQAKYFNIAVCDVNEVQSKINLLDTATQRAGYGFSDVCDQYLGGLLASDAGVVLGGTAAPTVITEQNAYEQMVQIKTALDKANLPKAGRKVVVPPEYEGFMLLDPRFVQVGTDASNDRLEMGTIYRAAGLEVLVSNNAPTFKYDTSKTGYKVVATSDLTGTFAQQILKTEAYRPEKRFADAVKGLHVYGAKVTRPAAVVAANVAF